MNAKRLRGVTLVELVVTIALLGILAAVGALILTPAFEAYFANQRRAQIADAADTALRRMSRDLRLAVPNSPRVDGSNRFLEVLMTKNGGRYRAEKAGPPGAEEPLEFSSADTVFDSLGTLPSDSGQQVAAGDFVVIHNLGIPGADAYDLSAATPNIARVGAFGAGALANEDRITLAAANRFPLESPGRRFFVVQGPVTFACNGVGIAGGEGTGTLRRWSGYDPLATQPTTLPPGASEALLASHVSACDMQYTPLPLLSRGLIAVRLAITRGNETVTLYHETHVNNIP